MEKYFSEKIRGAGLSFKATLGKCDLLVKFDEGTDYVGWNGCPEINITYHFAKQFDPYCFFHVPFMTEEAYRASLEKPKNLKRPKYSNHFDAFVYDPERKVAIIVEAKRLFNTSKLMSLVGDCNRINQNIGNLEHNTGIASVLHRFECRHGIRIDRRKVFSLILVETWQKDIELWWTLGKRDFNRKKRNGEISNRRDWDAWHKQYNGGDLRNYSHFSSFAVDDLPTINYPLFCCYAFKRISRLPQCNKRRCNFRPNIN